MTNFYHIFLYLYIYQYKIIKTASCYFNGCNQEIDIYFIEDNTYSNKLYIIFGVGSIQVISLLDLFTIANWLNNDDVVEILTNKKYENI